MFIAICVILAIVVVLETIMIIKLRQKRKAKNGAVEIDMPEASVKVRFHYNNDDL